MIETSRSYLQSIEKSVMYFPKFDLRSLILKANKPNGLKVVKKDQMIISK